MLKNNILAKNKRIKQIISLFILVILCTYIFFIDTIGKRAEARTIENYSASKIAKYPGYQALIDNLKSKYPNWQFKILYTGLDWGQVIKNETTAAHGRNLVEADKSGAWVCSTCGDKLYDSGWKCASSTAVSYYMDPRNWLDDGNIFQFEDLTYKTDASYTVEGVNRIIQDVRWMQGGTITYTNTSGGKSTINKSYAQVFLEAGKESGVNPYHLAARVRQEQGTKSTASSTGKGTYEGFVGYYNFFNINAGADGVSGIIKKALTTAKQKGWTNPEICIKAGSKFLKDQYINRGQQTLYLQKFDVDNSDGTLYYHQYMQNLFAAQNEAASMKKGHVNYNTAITFVIPVYENMPETKCISPNVGIVTQNVKVTGSNVQVRSRPEIGGSVIAKLNAGDVVLRIQCASNQNGGYYWDKIVLASGAKGYIARNYIAQIADVTNCNTIAVVKGTGVRLRNGPGTLETDIVDTLTDGQTVTIIEQGKYNNLGGYNWSRIKLNNGTQGYVADKYLAASGFKNATITCSDGSSVTLRSEANTSSLRLAQLTKGTVVTLKQENVANSNGYTWDKVVTSSGIEGFMANKYLIKSGGENVANSGKTGDVNNNNQVDAADYVLIKNHIMNKSLLSSSQISAGDMNKNGYLDAADYVIIKNMIMRGTV